MFLLYFAGTGEGRKVHGGLKLNSFVSPSVTIENSVFSRLTFNEFLFAMFSAHQFITAAVYINVLLGCLDVKATQNLAPECQISNTSFAENFRALNFRPDEHFRFTCHVTGSSFTDNHVLTSEFSTCARKGHQQKIKTRTHLSALS